MGYQRASRWPSGGLRVALTGAPAPDIWPRSAGYQTCRIADFLVGKPHAFQTLSAASGARAFGKPRYGRCGILRHGLNSGAPG